MSSNVENKLVSCFHLIKLKKVLVYDLWIFSITWGAESLSDMPREIRVVG
jgi:hypothetical protein